MNLATYFKQASSMSVSELAAAIGIKHGAQVRQWQHGYASRLPSPENCTAIERATRGEVTRRDLRPADWWLIWPELITAEHPEPTEQEPTC